MSVSFIIILLLVLEIHLQNTIAWSTSTLPTDWMDSVPQDVLNAMLENHTSPGPNYASSPYHNEPLDGPIQLWPGGVVPFEFSKYFWDNNSTALMKHAMDDIAQKTCINFVERANQTDYLEFLWGTDQFYHYQLPGRIALLGQTTVNIRASDLTIMGRIQWKILIALGILEEHRRFDRDDYVLINWDNVQTNVMDRVWGDERYYLTKFKADTTYGLPYDYDSVTHAWPMYGAKDRAMSTVVPINPPTAKIGQKRGLSELDILRLRRAYNCTGSSTGLPKKLPPGMQTPDGRNQTVTNTSASPSFNAGLSKSVSGSLEDSREHKLTGPLLTWPNGRVPYVLDPDFGEARMITLAMTDIEQTWKVCIKFVPRTNETDYLYLQNDFGCDSETGRMGGVQFVHLADYCRQNLGEIQQVLLSALGFIHQHQRYDRDQFVTINWDNIHEDRKYFMKYDREVMANNGDSTYDYDFKSVTFGSYLDFAKNRSIPTIIPSRKAVGVPFGERIGQRTRLSQEDMRRLRIPPYACSNIQQITDTKFSSPSSDMRSVNAIGKVSVTPSLFHLALLAPVVAMNM